MMAGITKDPPARPGPVAAEDSSCFRLRQRLRKIQAVTRISLGVLGVAILALAFGLAHPTQVRDSVHSKFWLQVATSNWSPDQQKKEELTEKDKKDGIIEKDYIGDAEYISGTVMALVVNLGSFVLIFGAIYEIWKTERRRIMETSTAYIFRDINIQQALYWYIINNYATNLKDEKYVKERGQLAESIRDIFNRANEELPQDIGAGFGEAGEVYLRKHIDDLIKIREAAGVPSPKP